MEKLINSKYIGFSGGVFSIPESVKSKNKYYYLLALDDTFRTSKVYLINILHCEVSFECDFFKKDRFNKGLTKDELIEVFRNFCKKNYQPDFVEKYLNLVTYEEELSKTIMSATKFKKTETLV